MFAIYLYHKEEKQKENLVRGIREQQCRVVAFYQAELAQFDIIPNTLVRLHGSLCVHQCPAGHSAMAEMFYICTVQYNSHWTQVAT